MISLILKKLAATGERGRWWTYLGKVEFEGWDLLRPWHRAGRKMLQNLPRRVKTTPSGRKSPENVPVNLDRQQIGQSLVN